LSRLSIPTGLAVLLTGLIALHASMTPDLASTSGKPAVVAPVPVRMDELDPSVTRMLLVHGSAALLATDEMTQLPDAVARALIDHGITLTLPSETGR
jgi:hypothetical protein